MWYFRHQYPTSISIIYWELFHLNIIKINNHAATCFHILTFVRLLQTRDDAECVSAPWRTGPQHLSWTIKYKYNTTDSEPVWVRTNITPTLAGGKVVEYFIHFHRTRNYQIIIFQQQFFTSCRNNLFNTFSTFIIISGRDKPGIKSCIQ